VAKNLKLINPEARKKLNELKKKEIERIKLKKGKCIY
jgi:hypothetical protein